LQRLSRLREEFGVPSKAALVVTVARLEAEKGINDLLDAVSQVLASPAAADTHFVTVGDGAQKSALLERSRRLGIESRVRFVGFRTDATDFIAAADLFVLPSPAEAFGLVLLEAMALAKPSLRRRWVGTGNCRRGCYGHLVLPSIRPL